MQQADREASESQHDVVVVGAGPNGLSAAIELARSGLSTLLIEAKDEIGGGARTSELTRPGFLHDVCSAVHPLGVASPFFRSLNLARHGLSWVHSPAPVAHVLDDGRAIVLERSIAATAANLGKDGDAYRRLLNPFVENYEDLLPMVLAGVRFPKAPLLFGRFGLKGLLSMNGLAQSHFQTEEAAALLAGMAAHSMVPLEAPGTAAFALVLAIAGHAVGWPVAQGGSAAISRALLACLRENKGNVTTGFRVDNINQLPRAKAYLFDLTPQQLLQVAGERLTPAYRRQLERFRYGPGVYKMDWALRGPVPWKDPACRRVATIHLSGSLSKIAEAEARVCAGHVAPPAFILVAQPSLFDGTRAPTGQHTAWAYCHVPHGSEMDMSQAIETQMERHAPGFSDLILARHTFNAGQFEQYNANYVGGDIGGGMSSLRQLFFRPTVSLDPYSTSAPNIFICSSSTPPGAGVHGMCGYWAARSALRKVFGIH